MQTCRGRRNGPGFASVDGLITSEIVCRRGIAVATDIGWKRSFATGVRIDIGLEAQCDFATIVDRNDSCRKIEVVSERQGEAVADSPGTFDQGAIVRGLTLCVGGGRWS